MEFSLVNYNKVGSVNKNACFIKGDSTVLLRESQV